jgi:hypothetical protein
VSPFDWKYTLTYCLICGVHYNIRGLHLPECCIYEQVGWGEDGVLSKHLQFSSFGCFRGQPEYLRFPVTRSDNVPDFLESVLPEEMTVFHWHGDTFGIPENAVSLYSSKACTHQTLLYKDHVLGLQFHLETTRDKGLLTGGLL